jgi:hypothetical protein
MFLDIIHLPVFIYKHRPVYFSKHNVSETGDVVFCNINRTVILDKERTMDSVQQHNICNKESYSVA